MMLRNGDHTGVQSPPPAPRKVELLLLPGVTCSIVQVCMSPSPTMYVTANASRAADVAGLQKQPLHVSELLRLNGVLFK